MIAAGVALILAWGAAEKGPTRWDDSWYLAAAVRLFDRFAEEGLAGYWRGFPFALGDKAPLITVLPFPFFCLIGRSVFAVYLFNAVSCVVLAVALYLFCRRFFEARPALLAVFFTLTAPLMAGLSRLFLVEYGLTALVMLSCLTLAKWETTERHRLLLLLGVLGGLGLLMKVTYPLFVGPIVAVVLWRTHSHRTARLLGDAALVAAPALALAGPWYWRNWHAVTQRSFQETYFAPVHPVEQQPAAAMALDYVVLIISQGAGAVAVAAALAGGLVWAARQRDNVLGGALPYVLPWVVSLPVFALSENRDLRLVAPMMPAFAIAAACLFDRFLAAWRRGRALWIAGVAAAAVLVTLANSFALFGARALRLGPWLLASNEMGYAFAPNPQRWPLAEVLDRLARRERLGAGSKLIVALGADTWSFNSNNLELQATLLRHPMEFYTTAYTSNPDEVRRTMSTAQYFLFKDGGTQQPQGRFRGGPLSLEFLTQGPLFREVEPAVDAPDGGRIRIFENASAGADVFIPARQPAAAPELPPVDLNFGGYLQVRGLQLAEQGGIFTLQLRWRSLTPPPRALRSFAHLVDADDKLLGSLDHEILRGSPPVDQWQPGDEGYEARYLALPAAAARGARLRLGLFDPETRLRVALRASTAPLKDDYTAAVVEPNQAAPAGHRFRMDPAPLAEANVAFDRGLRLTGYSLRRSGNVVWLRLRWLAAKRPKGRLWFFGHAVAGQDREARILLSFDQETALERLPPGRDGTLQFVQDIVRDVSTLGGEARFLRAGVFDLDQPADRLAIRSSSLPMNREQKALYLPLPSP